MIHTKDGCVAACPLFGQRVDWQQQHTISCAVQTIQDVHLPATKTDLSFLSLEERNRWYRLYCCGDFEHCVLYNMKK